MVVDTSALMAICLNEPAAADCVAMIALADPLIISAASVAEALIVGRRRGVGAEMARLLDGLGFEVAPVTLADARRTANAYDRWGKGVHPAGLNFVDCFAYALAKSRNRPLLFIGDDFTRTDVATP
jgi:ribonuclease VapC